MRDQIDEAIRQYTLAEKIATRISGYLNGTPVRVNPYDASILIVRNEG